MTSAEPVTALTTTATPLDRALLPRRALVGDTAYNLAFAGIGGGIFVGAIAVGLPWPFAIVFALSCALPAVWLVDRLLLATRATARFMTSVAPAAEASGQGRWDDAVRIYASVAEAYRSRPGLHGVALLGEATSRARRGEWETGLAMLIALDNYKRAKHQPMLGRPLANTIAVTCAQLKRVDDAREWLSIARTRPLQQGKIYDAHIEGLILMREGRWSDAMEAFDREWIDLGRVLPLYAHREIAVRRAFVLERLGRDDELTKALAAIQPSRPDELAWMGFAWPELADFLRRRGLVSAA